jgi:16S rRNA (uracil1498-N3)-methyltransferase
MHRFYLSAAVTGRISIITDSAQVHHMRDVLRLKKGNRVAVFDDQGNEYDGRIMNIDKTQVEITVQKRKSTDSGQKLTLAIACSLPKKGKMDDIVDKLTQLGVDVIIPLDTQRGVVKLAYTDETRYARWRRIAVNAAEQSRRPRLPVISPVMSFADVLAAAPDYDLKLIPTLTGASRPLREVITGVKPAAVLVLIGPEGDFSPAEVEQALEAGFVPVSLGDTVLRVETAALAVTSFLKLAFAGGMV